MKTTASQQLFSFGQHASTDLRCYPEAFVLVQSYAFGPSVGRHLEASHITVKYAGKVRSRLAKPVYTAARARSPQLLRMLDDDREYDWLVQNWKKRHWVSLLGTRFAECRLVPNRPNRSSSTTCL